MIATTVCGSWLLQEFYSCSFWRSNSTMIQIWSHCYWKLGLASSWAIAGTLAELSVRIITSSGNYAFAQAVFSPTIRPSSFRAIEEPSLRFHSIDSIDVRIIRPNVRMIRPNSFRVIKEPSLRFEAVDVSKLIDQSCSTKSKFFVTGRGGLPPTPGELLRSDPALVDLGPPAPTWAMHRGSQRPIRGHSIKNYSSSAISSNPTNSPPATITEAQGWIANSKGEVVLTAQAPNVTPRSPWITSASCHKLKTSFYDSPASVLTSVEPGSAD